MCEFNIEIIPKNPSHTKIENILMAYHEDGAVICRDILGSSEIIKSAIISEVSVPSEKLTIFQSDILDPIMRFIELLKKCKVEKKYDPKLEQLWDDIKNKGSEMIESLKK